MHFSTVFAVAAAAFLPAAVVAQTTGANHQIIVGLNGTLTYTPANITATVGDSVTFVFAHGNHTVTQSTFAAPCVYTQNATAGTVGFQSGFQPIASNQSLVPSVTMLVNTTAPIWFYCQQANHCQQGMVGAINAVEGSAKSYDAFKALAMSGGTGTSASGGSSASSAPTSAPSQSTTSGSMVKAVCNAGVMLAAVGAMVAVLL
ncbi:hypothetical protein DACRYDRAFT_103969 [Dacryopinax primogenitus]|uniref:Cupredoxin n=1 Tax=Dacryopinax primogenitus (strain DJM 731) TaxID=1858805 RepID=M5GGH2_DACPD|nr:uncharacterized protein DACRYDRAFT_103969 [Dacryopinax primogenitus]EJU05483.1 hypothetical protein DACRYDRAFT_103969 [Dacryopinax primogenitus]